LGFSLAELLVVIGIIAMLVSILMPALARAREQAQLVRCQSNLRQIGLGIQMYANANKGRFPLASHTAAPIGWIDTLVPYGTNPAVRLCPVDQRPSPRTSYLTNSYMQPLEAWIDFNPISGATLPGGRSKAYLLLTDVKHPAATAYVVESNDPGDHVHAVGWTMPDQVAGSIDVMRHRDRANYWYVDGHVAAIRWSDIQQTFSVSNSFMDPATAQ
jgi:prepilin-type processing-associated H-X9-DG protein